MGESSPEWPSLARDPWDRWALLVGFTASSPSVVPLAVTESRQFVVTLFINLGTAGVLTLDLPAANTADQTPAPRSAKSDPFPVEQREALRDRAKSALGLFYDCYFDQVYGYVRRMVGEEHLAEDLTQEILMHIMQHLESYDPTRALRPWVFAIATNKVRDYWRGKRHQTRLREISLDPGDSGGGWTPPSNGRPEDEIGASETTLNLTRAIEALPESMRLTLVLRYYEGLSFEAIGEIIDRNEVAVRKRYSRALEALRKALVDGANGRMES